VPERLWEANGKVTAAGEGSVPRRSVWMDELEITVPPAVLDLIADRVVAGITPARR
jgi:hypothetical protein